MQYFYESLGNNAWSRMDVFIFRLSLLLWMAYNTIANNTFSGECVNNITLVDWYHDTCTSIYCKLNVEINANEFQSILTANRTLLLFSDLLMNLVNLIDQLEYSQSKKNIINKRSTEQHEWSMFSSWKVYDVVSWITGSGSYSNNFIKRKPLHNAPSAI